jgi:cytochrome c'
VRLRVAVLVCVILPSLSGCGGIGGPSHAGQPTIQGRSMSLMLADIDQIRAFVYGSGDLNAASTAATDLVSWSGRMAELFPPGESSADYLDMSADRVRDAPAAMTRTAESLLMAVRTGDRVAIGAKLTETERDGCGACHLSGLH